MILVIESFLTQPSRLMHEYVLQGLRCSVTLTTQDTDSRRCDFCNLIPPGIIQILSINAETYLLFIVLVGTFAIDISLTPFWRCNSREVRMSHYSILFLLLTLLSTMISVLFFILLREKHKFPGPICRSNDCSKELFLFGSSWRQIKTTHSVQSLSVCLERRIGRKGL